MKLIPKERIIYRTTALSGDIIFLSIVIILADEGGIPLFFIYLWIIVGNGIRYGIRYLFISSILSIGFFILVIYFTPIWQQPQLFSIAIGLLISFIILPIYILNLIARLSTALESEKEANGIKRAFLANMNHELRTPLNSILNVTEMLQADIAPYQIRRMIGMIQTSSSNLLNIINGILDLSKIEAGAFEIEQKDFDLLDIIHEVNQIILPLALNKNLLFPIFVSSNCHFQYTGPSKQIKQILINTLSNAVKFTEEGYISLSIHAKKISNKRQELVFIINDTGIGIEEKKQKSIFKPFVQEDMSITRKYGGTGLGLAISSELAKLTGGTLLLTSKKNTGTTIQFNIVTKVKEQQAIFHDYKINIVTVNRGDCESKISAIYSQMGFSIKNVPIWKLHELSNDCILLIGKKNFKNSLFHDNYPIILIEDTDDNDDISSLGATTTIKETDPASTLINAVRICTKIFLSKSENIDLIYSRKKLSILLAEDDPILSELFKLYFLKLNHNCEFTTNGAEALHSLINNSYDIAILDLHLPDLSGLDIARKYRILSERPIPIILLTADTYNTHSIPDIKYLNCKVIYKPILPNKLFSIIHEVLGLPIDYENKHKYPPETTTTLINHDIFQSHLDAYGTVEIDKVLEVYDQEIITQLKRLSMLTGDGYIDQTQGILHRIKGASLSLGSINFAHSVSHFSKLIQKRADKKLFSLLLSELYRIHHMTMTAYKDHIQSQNI